MVEGDEETYQGQGFTGRRLGESAQQRVVEPSLTSTPQSSAPASHQGGATQPAPPTMHCLSCNTQAQWLPNGQLWCPRCQATLQVQDRTQQVGALAGGIVALIAVLGIALGIWYLASSFNFEEPGEGDKNSANLTVGDCTVMQSLVNSMAGSSQTAIDKAIAVQVLGDDPSVMPPGDLEIDGGAARITCGIPNQPLGY